jgi:hypothetical protein
MLVAGVLLVHDPREPLRLSAHAVGIVAACLLWAIDNNLTRKVAGADPVQIAAIGSSDSGQRCLDRRTRPAAPAARAEPPPALRRRARSRAKELVAALARRPRRLLSLSGRGRRATRTSPVSRIQRPSRTRSSSLNGDQVRRSTSGDHAPGSAPSRLRRATRHTSAGSAQQLSNGNFTLAWQMLSNCPGHRRCRSLGARGLESGVP